MPHLGTFFCPQKKKLGTSGSQCTVYITDGAIVNVLSHSDLHDHGMTITLKNDAFTIRNPKSYLQSGLVFGRVRGLYAVDMRT